MVPSFFLAAVTKKAPHSPCPSPSTNQALSFVRPVGSLAVTVAEVDL